MVTVTFQIKPYLAAYMYVRYKNHLDVPPDRFSSSLSAIHLLDTQPIYHFLHQLSIPTLPTPHGTKPEISPSPSPPQKRQKSKCI